jgi:glycosyltransferase involved in cell wall biosynthesis
LSKKVSVVVPVYNAEKYLHLTLSSIINQTYDNLEIIVIDDCSTDNSKEVIKEFAQKDKRIIPYYSEINQGVSKTRNMGLKTFSGDYILFVDADDLMAKDCIEIQMNAAEKYNGDIIDSYHLVVYEDKKKKYYFTEGKVPKNIMVMGSLKDNSDILFKATYITGKIIKRNLVEGLFFDEELRRYEDMVFEHRIKSNI